MTDHPEDNKKEKNRKILLWAALLLAVLVAVILIRPRYLRYIDADHRETCYGAREYIGEQYGEKLQAFREDTGAEPDLSACRRMVEECFRDIYQVEAVDGNDSSTVLQVAGLCRSGGVITVEIDPETKKLTISCSAEGHETYTE